MAMVFVPFHPDHIGQMQNYGGQEQLVMSVQKDDLYDIHKRSDAYTGMVDGRIVGCAGIVRVTQHRGVAWGVFQQTGRNEFLSIHMRVRQALRDSDLKRIEAFVDPRSPRAMRWIAMLGFVMWNSYWPYFYPDGGGATAWVYRPEHN